MQQEEFDGRDVFFIPGSEVPSRDGAERGDAPRGDAPAPHRAPTRDAATTTGACKDVDMLLPVLSKKLAWATAELARCTDVARCTDLTRLIQDLLKLEYTCMNHWIV